MERRVLNCCGITEPKQLHSTLCDLLCFPAWYGHNLDALFDCLTDLEDPVCLHLEGWDTLAPWREGFAQTFADAAEQNSLFTFILA